MRCSHTASRASPKLGHPAAGERRTLLRQLGTFPQRVAQVPGSKQVAATTSLRRFSPQRRTRPTSGTYHLAAAACQTPSSPGKSRKNKTPGGLQFCICRSVERRNFAVRLESLWPPTSQKKSTATRTTATHCQCPGAPRQRHESSSSRKSRDDRTLMVSERPPCMRSAFAPVSFVRMRLRAHTPHHASASLMRASYLDGVG